MTDIPEQSKVVNNIPEEYKSGFSFLSPGAQKEFSEMEYHEIKHLFLARLNEKARYVHELWRTGRLEVVYQYFMDHERLMRESIVIIAPDGEYSTDELTVDDIAFNTAILLQKDISSEECIAFINDVLCAGANAHDDQSFGDEPLYPDHVAWVTDNVWELASKYYKGMENL